MTGSGGLLSEAREIATTVAVPHNEPPGVIRRRRIVVAVVLVVGAVLLGYSLTRPPGDESFYWLTLALAGVWALGALLSGPLHLGCVRFRGRNQRPVITGTAVGLALGGAFVAGGLIAREIPGVREYITRVLEFADYGPLVLVVFITVINGLAEEMYFRGALYTALGRFHPVLVSTVLYVIATSATTGNPMLGFAAIVLGTVCALERRATGGVLAPMLTHFFWGLVMVLALPPIFGV
ncbi:CPBP family intramembrane glutamic endopeptidase [Mycolicibacterium holsaticum]|jgi:membrane protease YdiL (CAAX protease family)|uniref:Abortive infection protein n=1 Tax=Mycolicibacterium holsaticum TaxID=152142 RepID=A0A1E3RYP8_9MYCO|nr:type II CAAX endopeptidase family protein [Mycolicibacterium holsaticum]MDA4105914.1 abortive infection protein [Mycolicibacterium holsaticum DSM 44478 = JCM 12374]ODQ94941.1 abortive infection protein [Mycolicibacterium holsaticum]QZA13740.1 CPBP family intramembrane metalloprotease [Mycolicibacterium holsaticum DSM 44478 = JCM 12374]UNC08798.1 CPBP family intramembrane metalloprotease [Mycolicibacterium holsaticum DSM 44478 = JCM 12374]